MPGRSKTQAEAKYNVTTDFQNWNLHVAAAAGNLGLVKYALAQGQPVNSVLDGVLPLHAACSGGDEQCVRVLLEHGADVNAERLPRKYSSTRSNLPSSSAAATIVGTSGSTPLHFAAANGHTHIVRLLLQRGARANRADKHGVTPEAVARQNRWLETAEALKGWEEERDRDLMERPKLSDKSTPELDTRGVEDPPLREFARDRSGTAEPLREFTRASRDRLASLPVLDTSGDATSGKRVKVKRSIDHALNKLAGLTRESSLSRDPSALTQVTSPSLNASTPTSVDQPTLTTSPSDPSPTPLGEYTFGSNASRISIPPSPRTLATPSLGQPPSPHLDARGPPPEALAARRPSLPQIFDKTPSPKPRTYLRRPTSAGNGSDRTRADDGGSRKLGSKYSLLNMFKKGDSSTPELPSLPPSQSTPALASKPSLPTVPSPSAARPSPTTPLAIPCQGPIHLSSTSSPNQYRSRSKGSESSAGPRTYSDSSSRPAQAFKHDINNRERSGSNGSRTGTVFEQDEEEERPENEKQAVQSTSPTRPGILRGHNRSGSSSNKVYQTSSNGSEGPGASTASFRALRFDATAEIAAESKPRTSFTIDDSKDAPSELPAVPRISNRSSRRPGSVGSTASSHNPSLVLKRPGSAGSGATRSSSKDTRIRSPKRPGSAGSGLNRPSNEEGFVQQDRLGELRSDFPGRTRNQSTTSSTSSLSPNSAVHQTAIEFPFSIPKSAKDGLLVPANRTRGDSVSSDGSANPALSSSGTTSNDSNASTAAIVTPSAPSFLNPQGRKDDVHIRKMSDGSLSPDTSTDQGLTSRRANVPLDINIHSISSHAQAEALVQQAQRNIFELPMEGPIPADAVVGEVPLRSAAGQGWTPLSARLAEYGASLAIERRLKKEEEDRANQGQQFDAAFAANEAEADSEVLKVLARTKSAVFAREPSASGRHIPRAQRQRRPNTANGTSAEKTVPSARINGHQATSSASAMDRFAQSSAPLRKTTSRLREIESEMASDLERASSVESMAPAVPRKREADRLASATKLTRMGFAAPDARQAPPPVAKPRFGGLKTLFQSIKGNSKP